MLSVLIHNPSVLNACFWYCTSQWKGLKDHLLNTWLNKWINSILTFNHVNQVLLLVNPLWGINDPFNHCESQILSKGKVLKSSFEIYHWREYHCHLQSTYMYVSMCLCLYYSHYTLSILKFCFNINSYVVLFLFLILLSMKVDCTHFKAHNVLVNYIQFLDINSDW